MEFQALTDFFSSLAYAKKKYPQYTTYVNKYLKNLSEEEQHREVEQFKKFLILNQNTPDRVLDCVLFQTGKPKTTLFMPNFLGETHKNTFWQNLFELEKILFRFGKPKDLPQTKPSATAAGIEGAMERFKDNRLMTDILGQAKSFLTNLDGIQDINDLFTTPEFQDIVEKMKNNIMSGQYSLADLTSSVNTAISSVQAEVDDSTKEALSAVSNAMSSMENNQQINLDELKDVVGSLLFSK